MNLNRRLLVDSLAAAVSRILPTLSFAQANGTTELLPDTWTAFRLNLVTPCTC
jgi:hypothetical protein